MTPIFAALAQRDGQTVAEIAAACGASESTVGHRLRLMRDRGAATSVRVDGLNRWSAVADSEAMRRHELHERILGALADGPRTTVQIADALGITRTTAYGRLCTLERGGRVRSEMSKATRWMLPEHAGPAVREDRWKDRTADHRRIVALASLAEAPATPEELAERLGWEVSVTNGAIWALSREGLIIGTPQPRTRLLGRPLSRYEPTYSGRRRLARREVRA